jgi:hypothetical protein
MLSLFKATYRDAASAGWEPAKYAFGVVLSKIEDGEFSWADSLEIAEERRTSVMAKTTELIKLMFEKSIRDCGTYNVQAWRVNNNLSNGNNGSKSAGEMTTKVCVFYNNGTCVHKADHKSASTYWKHVCRKCWSAEHVAKVCEGF